MNFFKSKRKLLLMGIDLSVTLFAYLFTSALVFFDGGLTRNIFDYLLNLSIFIVFIFSARILLSVYTNVWRYANSTVYLYMILADALGGASATLLTYIFSDYVFSIGVWQSFFFVAMVNIATLSTRFAYQVLYKYLNRDSHTKNNKIGVAIVGAGQVGALLAEELTYNAASHYRPICFVDKDKEKAGSRVCGIDVLFEDEGIVERLKHLPVQEIFLALPKISGKEAGRLHEFYAQTGCKVKLYDFPIIDTQEISTKRIIREIKIEDLLFRDTLRVFNNDTQSFYSGKTVLVTGGGGSIGSELCRQIAKCTPKRLIIFDIYENNAYDIQQELLRKYGENINLAVEIGSVRDRARLEAVFAHYTPDIVMHAAAHKHVPLMEHSSCEAIKNNVLGTYNTADMAEKYGADKFILISTDKAVNPTNVMGASKRMCEMVVQARTDSRTAFCAVRFGNVLGSNGSVIPLFKRQIDAGGPITVTDKRIIRYFMTIPEASGLVMQAGSMAKGGDLFVLDMGKPVKILDLAENMIRLSGLVPYRDIEIVETGLRPGEKLYEELLIKTEKLTKTENNMIFIERDRPFTREEIDEKLQELRLAVIEAQDKLETSKIKETLKRLVPTFHDPEEVNSLADSCAEMKMVETV